MIDVTENEDGSFTISWDENDPIESRLNDWTEQDFVRAIMVEVENVLAHPTFYGNYEGPLYARHPDLVDMWEDGE
ncbi:MAG: hypothetical protein ACO22S_06975 [Burkholderiaceae bacterium]